MIYDVRGLGLRRHGTDRFGCCQWFFLGTRDDSYDLSPKQCSWSSIHFDYVMNMDVSETYSATCSCGTSCPATTSNRKNDVLMFMGKPCLTTLNEQSIAQTWKRDYLQALKISPVDEDGTSSAIGHGSASYVRERLPYFLNLYTVNTTKATWNPGQLPKSSNPPPKFSNG